VLTIIGWLKRFDAGLGRVSWAWEFDFMESDDGDSDYDIYGGTTRRRGNKKYSNIRTMT